jgi:uncharacterized membrane protein YphA (DoxX/SURF4 family)
MRDDPPVSYKTRAGIGTVLRLALAGILFWSGLAKLLESEEGRRAAVIAWRVLPPATVEFFSWALPGLEIALAAMLLVGLFTRWAALLTALLMAGFMLGLASVWIRGYSIDCGCFGGGGDTSEAGKTGRYTAELLRDFLFMGMAAWLVAWPVTYFSLDRGPHRAEPTDEDGDVDLDYTEVDELEEPNR